MSRSVIVGLVGALALMEPVVAAPKTTAPKSPATVAAKGGQKTAQPADPVGDICLLPDIAGFTH